MTLNRWDPLRDLLNFQEKMNRLMDRACEDVPAGRCASWTPVVDVLETPDSYVLRADLPGVGKDKISIEVSGNRLIIQGERPIPAEPRIAAYYTIERETGFFRRSFALPGTVDPDQAEARYVDGVLDIILPKSQEHLECNINVVCLD